MAQLIVSNTMIGCILLCTISIASLSTATDDANKVVIFVDSHKGSDHPSCLSGYGYCRCLSYVLGHGVQENVSLVVDLSSFDSNYEFVEPMRQLCNRNMESDEYDLRQRNVTFLGENTGIKMDMIQFTNFEKLTFKKMLLWELPYLKNGNLVEFHGCTFMNDDDDIYFINTNKGYYYSLHKLVFSRCTFTPIIKYFDNDIFRFFRQFSFQNIQIIFLLTAILTLAMHFSSFHDAALSLSVAVRLKTMIKYLFTHQKNLYHKELNME